MGNFEKLVVLTVLFLSAIVLAVSLSTGEGDDPGGNPLSAADKARKGEDVAKKGAGAGEDRMTLNAEGERKTPSAGDKSTPKDGLIKTGGKTEDQPTDPVAAVPVKTNALGHPRALRTRQGLDSSPLEDYMLYSAVDGDTWSGLADRFYKSGTFVALLQAANEDVAKPTAGETLLVPVYDFRAAPAGHAPREAPPVREAGPAPVQTYVVVDGDNLWDIAGKVYGSGARWEEIFKANRDVMADADSLTLGMTLRIP